MLKHVFVCLVLLFAFPTLGWSASYIVCTGVTQGDWNSSATWALSSSPSSCKAGVPATGDTVTIPAGAIVTVSDTESYGLSSAVATDDCLIKSGGTLQINPGGVLNAKGNLDVERGGSFLIFGGTFAFVTPQSSTNYATKFLNTGSGTNPVFTICAEPTCSGPGAGNAVFTQTGPGTGSFVAGTYSYAPTFTASYATFSNLGSSTVNAVNYTMTTALNPISLSNTLFLNDGYVLFNIGNTAAPILSADRVAFIKCADRNGGMGPTCVEFRGSVASSSPRLLTNIAAYNTAYNNHPQTLFLNLSGAQVGKSTRAGDDADVPGFSGYNVRIVSGLRIPLTVRSSFVVEDQGSNGDACYLVAPNNSQLWQDQICYSHLPNQHEWMGYGGVGPASPNLAQRLICDGDGYYFTDWGDFWQDQGTSTLRDSLSINACGTLVTAGTTTAQVSVLNNTIYQSFGATIGETGGSPTQIVAFRNNLIAWPFTAQSGGFDAYSAFQRQTSLSMDYNAFYGMPGSNDPSGCALPTCPTTLPQISGWPPLVPHAALGGILSYLRLPVTGLSGLTAKSLTSFTGTTITCSTCDFITNAVQPGDYFLDNTLLAKPYVTVAQVLDSTHLLLASAIPGLAVGHSFDIRPSYWASPGWVLGDANNGAHDLHVNPNFADVTRTLCTWLTSQGGHAPCGHTGDNVATAGTSSTVIACYTCDFVAWGINASDFVADYTSGGSFRARAQVASVTDAHTLTVTPAITGMVAGDHFSFITATRSIGLQIMAISGYDYQGNRVTPSNDWSVFSAMRFLQAGFAPQNPALRGAGSPADGSPDIGAVSVTMPASSRRPAAYWRH